MLDCTSVVELKLLNIEKNVLK